MFPALIDGASSLLITTLFFLSTDILILLLNTNHTLIVGCSL